MSLFRRVELPPEIPGALHLHSLPGRWEPLEQCWDEARREDVSAIVCLTPDEEMAEKSPEYLRALSDGSAPCDVWRFPIVDYGAPEDAAGFARILDRTAERLREGGSALVHCAAGIGRTGTFAAGILLRLGVDRSAAVRRVRSAGSHAEHPVQAAALTRLARRSDP